MNIRFGKPAPVKQPSLNAGAASIAARSIASKAELISTLDSLPRDGHAILVTMYPQDDGLMIRATHHPADISTVEAHGLYNFAAEYLCERIKE